MFSEGEDMRTLDVYTKDLGLHINSVAVYNKSDGEYIKTVGE